MEKSEIDPASSLLKPEDEEGHQKTEQKLKIMSWNINGMKTLNMHEVLKQLDCSILAVQETKLARKQLDQTQVIPPGYSSYFSFSTNRMGYSGVAIFCKEGWSPSKAEEGLCMHKNEEKKDEIGAYPVLTEEEEPHVKFANADGRTVIIQNNVMLPDGSDRPLTLINVYCPRLRNDPEDPTNNTEFKYTFHKVLHERAKLLVEQGSFVIIAGDINISHRWIDHCDGDPKTFVSTEFRQLLDDLLASGFVDSFRFLHPDQESAFTCWNTMLNCRENNYGTRIDYMFVDKELAKYLESAEIHPEIHGSDHCPISATFHSLKNVSRDSLPSFATKYYPEFKGIQKNLKDFLASASTSRKRPLDEPESLVKVQSAKRIQQTNLKSFFGVKSNNSSKTKLLNNTSNPLIEKFKNDTQQEESDSNQLNSSQDKNNVNGSNISNVGSSQAWKQLMKAPEVPLCEGHKEPCKRRTVKKKGANFGREFWSCSHGVGKSDDPNANCNYFQWVKPTSSSLKSGS